MALLATVETTYGESRELYIRLNNFEQLANHGVPVVARFRGYADQEAYNDGKPYIYEQVVEFAADAPAAPWPLAYGMLAAQLEVAGTEV